MQTDQQLIQDQANQVISKLTSALVDAGNIMLFAQNAAKKGARSGMEMPDIGDSIDSTIDLDPLPFTQVELDDITAQVAQCVEAANRTELAAQRVTMILDAAKAVLPKIFALAM